MTDGGKCESVRDALVRCFVDAQFETMESSAKKLGMAQSREGVEKMIVFQVREAFARVGADFDQPKAEDFPKVMEVLARKAAMLGKPAEEIERHRGEIESLLKRLP